MNRSLLDDRQKFISQQSTFLAVPRKRPHVRSADTDQRPNNAKQPALTSHQSAKQRNGGLAENVGQTSQQKFAALCRVVNYLQGKHLEGDYNAKDLDEILSGCGLEVTSKVKIWLKKDALLENPRIRVTRSSDDQVLFSYEPPVSATNKKSLLRLLKEHHRTGAGGILVDDIKKSVPNADKILKVIANEIVVIQRQDKKEIVFYNDKAAGQPFTEELKQLWRSVSLDNVDMTTIDQYLAKRGIFHIRDKFVPRPPMRKQPGRQRRQQSNQSAQPVKLLNTHMQGVLQDYNTK